MHRTIAAWAGAAWVGAWIGAARAEDAPTPAAGEAAAVPAGEAAAWAPVPGPGEVPALRYLELTDGQEIHGQARRRADGAYEVWIDAGAAGEPLVIPAALVASVGTGEGGPEDLPLPQAQEQEAPGELEASNAVSYFYAPSAFMLGRGRGYVSQKEIAITTAAFGVTDFLDIQVGTIIPTLFVADSQVAVLGAKAGVPIVDNFRIGAGTQVFLFAGEQIGFLFGNTTVGSRDRNFTLGGGVATTFNFSNREYAPVIVAAGTYRLGRRAALMTENWLVLPPPGERTFLSSIFLPSGGVRLFASNYAVDLGLIIYNEEVDFVVPIPWVSFTWNWALPYADRSGAPAAPARPPG